jgi:hypothetical protein
VVQKEAGGGQQREVEAAGRRGSSTAGGGGRPAWEFDRGRRRPAGAGAPGAGGGGWPAAELEAGGAGRPTTGAPGAGGGGRRRRRGRMEVRAAGARRCEWRGQARAVEASASGGLHCEKNR